MVVELVDVVVEVVVVEAIVVVVVLELTMEIPKDEMAGTKKLLLVL